MWGQHSIAKAAVQPTEGLLLLPRSSPCPALPRSESLFNVDAWNDVVAAARSIMYSITSQDSIFDVFWFSNEVERIGTTVRTACMRGGPPLSGP